MPLLKELLGHLTCLVPLLKEPLEHLTCLVPLLKEPLGHLTCLVPLLKEPLGHLTCLVPLLKQHHSIDQRLLTGFDMLVLFTNILKFLVSFLDLFLPFLAIHDHG